MDLSTPRGELEDFLNPSRETENHSRQTEQELEEERTDKGSRGGRA